MKLLTDEQIRDFRQFINAHDFFYLTGHKEPDCDCICSCVALSLLIDSFGKPFQLLNAGPFKRTEIKKYESMFSNAMQFLTEDERRRTALIIADCSEYSRLGDIEGDVKNLDTCVIDHHKTASAPENALCVIDATAPSTCSIVQLLYEGIYGAVPQQAAEILFTGFCTDTGFFRFLSTDSAEVFKATARLVSSGANPRTTYEYITGGKSYDSRKLLGAALNNAEQYLDGRLVVACETLDDTQKWGQAGRDSDALYSLLLSVHGVEAVVFARQETEHTCTLGFRSKDAIDVSAIAAQFGGGGHKNASGASCNGQLETLIPVIVKSFARIM